MENRLGGRKVNRLKQLSRYRQVTDLNYYHPIAHSCHENYKLSEWA